MSRGKYTPEFKAKIVLKVLQGERELGAIAAKERDKMLKTIGQLTVERNFL